jgi:glutaminyl-peptide cyclotransferase
VFQISHLKTFKQVKKMRLIALFSLALAVAACSKKDKERVTTNFIPFELVRIFPHDASAFTQGLVIHNGKLYESTGQYGTSWIAEVDIATGKQQKKVNLDKKYFGEGITILNNKIYHLTWQTHEGFVYDASSYEKLKSFEYPYEGWGITHNDQKLILSDGTSKIHFLDTVTLKEEHTITVKESGQEIGQLNELEYIDGFIYANLWQTAYIVKINPTTGEVVGRLDLSSLAAEVSKFNGNFDVLNGIAYEKKSKSFLVTGKLWPVLFAIKLKGNAVKEN